LDRKENEYEVCISGEKVESTRLEQRLQEIIWCEFLRMGIVQHLFGLNTMWC